MLQQRDPRTVLLATTNIQVFVWKKMQSLMFMCSRSNKSQQIKLNTRTGRHRRVWRYVNDHNKLIGLLCNMLGKDTLTIWLTWCKFRPHIEKKLQYKLQCIHSTLAFVRLSKTPCGSTQCSKNSALNSLSTHPQHRNRCTRQKKSW
jgi:hypothetical protein